MCCAGWLLMGVAPRIPGGGGKFKKTFENLSDAEKVLIWTNSNHTNSNYGSVTIDLTGYKYAVYAVFCKLYSSSAVGDGQLNFVSPEITNNYVTDSRVGNIVRMVRFTDSGMTINGPLNQPTKWDNVIPYQVFGVVGTELK